MDTLDIRLLAWMAWTWPTAAFFAPSRCCSPAWRSWEYCVARRRPAVGVLGIETTRGDRLFISLLGSAFIHLAWLGLVGPEPVVGSRLSRVVYAIGGVPLGVEGETVGAAACRQPLKTGTETETGRKHNATSIS